MGKDLNSFNVKYLSMDEFDDLIGQIETTDLSSKFRQRNITIFLVAQYCGLRASEVGLIELTDVDLKKRTIFCRRLKGSASNTLLIQDERVFEELERYHQERTLAPSTSKFLFPSKSGKPINRRTLDILMKHYCSFTGINRNKWHFHALKHTRAMELIATPNTDLLDVQWYLGHKCVGNTMIYLQYAIEAKQRFYDNNAIHERKRPARKMK